MNMTQLPEMNPFQELKFFYTHLFKGIRKTRWLNIIRGIIIAFLGAFVVLILAYRLLDGIWDWRINVVRALIIAGLVGANLILQGAMREATVSMQDEIISMQAIK